MVATAANNSGVNRTDRLSALTNEYRVLAVGILLAIIPIGPLLYFFPSQTSIFWGWIARDPRSATLIGAGYLSGILYFVFVLRENEWAQARNAMGALLLFCLFLLFASVTDFAPFRPYHPYTLIWLVIYYTGPLFIPMIYRLQSALARSEQVPGPRISSAWRTVLLAQGVFFLALAFIGFVLADALAAVWPWPILSLELRTFLGQVAIVGWLGAILFDGGLEWRRHRLGYVLVVVLALMQLFGIVYNASAYNWSSPMGILLPLMYLEWVVVSLLLIWRYERA